MLKRPSIKIAVSFEKPIGDFIMKIPHGITLVQIYISFCIYTNNKNRKL